MPSAENVNWTKVGLMIGALLVGVWLGVLVFNVSLSTSGTLTFVGFFVWMPMGMHSGHGGHGLHDEESPATSVRAARRSRH